MPKFKTQR